MRAHNLIILTLVLFLAATAPKVCADSAKNREYQVKGAFLYNFIKFVDWPEEKNDDNNKSFTIGIIGKDPFGSAFKSIKDKPVKGKKVVVKHFKDFEALKKSKEKNDSEANQQIESIKNCHFLFICDSEAKSIRDIINAVKANNILTVADTTNFLEVGGIINFVMENKKVRFEINNTAAKRSKLEIRSQLLRLAKRVVEE